ncbi:hypothetical protein ACEPAF_3104 [Sanghuangporus sanghuang]
MQRTKEIVFKIPDLISLTPFLWIGCNPLYSCTDMESTKWMGNHGVLSNAKQAQLVATQAELLGAYVYPYAEIDSLRIATDLLTIMFALDEVTDDQAAKEALATRNTFVKALTSESNDDTSPIAMFTRDFMNRLSGISNKPLDRFIAHFIEYIDATAREAGNRTDGKIPTFEEHLCLRRDNGGLFSAFDIIEVALGITLPPEVLVDNNFQSIVLAANDMISYSNDIYSYAKEVMDGVENCNAITILMHSKGLSHQEAMNKVGELYKDGADTIVACKAVMRSFGPDIDGLVSNYVFGLEQWICGHNAWSLLTRKFFGEETEEVIRTGVMRLNQLESAE